VTQFLTDYGLFLAQLLTLALVVLVIVAFISANTRRGAHSEGLTVQHLNKRHEESTRQVRRVLLGRRRFRRERRAQRKDAAARAARAGDGRPRIFVIDFRGDLRASAAASLREEVSAVLAVADDRDQVLVRLENAGGTVHEHGFAASQLARIRHRGLKLMVAIDKVAASGGYLMACVAHHVMAAPFAIVGSIGVLAQLPNFHRFLEDKGVDFEQITAGQHKRTLTMFGRNTEDGRRKVKEELEDVHELFKQQIAEHRPQVEIDRVATGEHWYGLRALELKLVDEIRTSDDFLLEAVREHDVYLVAYRRRKRLAERFLGGVESLLSR
jgi:serine protease SohB